jgi:hypothetical protein
VPGERQTGRSARHHLQHTTVIRSFEDAVRANPDEPLYLSHLCTATGPGAVATPINVSTMDDPAKLELLDKAIPLRRMARPEEIARVVGFVAGEGASYLTATTVFADGGLMRSSVGL